MSTLHKLTSPAQLLENPNLSGMGKSDVGIEVNGSGHTIRDVEATGGYQTILFDGATEGVIVDGLKVTDPGDKSDPNVKGYGLYFSSGGKTNPNRAPLIRNVDITISEGTWGAHCVRGYATDGLVAVDWTLKHFGKFAGHPLNFRQGENCTFHNLKTDGRCNQLGPDKKDGEINYRVKKFTFVGCQFDLNSGTFADDGDVSPFVFWSGVDGVEFYNCRFHQHNPKKAILRCEASWKTRPAATNIVLNTCSMSGGSKLVDGGNPSGVTLINC